MTETRQIGGMTVHFLGDNAAQLAKSFDRSLRWFAAVQSRHERDGADAKAYLCR